jgi:peroxiredoxin
MIVPRTLLRRTLLAAALAVAVAAPAFAAPQLGQPAPAFKAMDAQGHARSLAAFAGKTVVLEWTNSGCPYVGKHYGSGTMQALQKKETAEGVVWLTISSSAPDMQGYFTPPTARAWAARQHWSGSALLLDSAGKIGREYEAKNTPHMFVIDKAGRIAYMGGIDDRPYADPESLKGAKPYVAMALADLKAGRPVATPVSQPYGCSVKYNSAD